MGLELTFTATLHDGLVGAQSVLPSEMLNRLPINQVTESDGQIYVRVVGQRRGVIQPLDSALMSRATVMAGHWLCNFTPKPNQRLNVTLQGVKLIQVQESAGTMDVVIRLQKQKPDCIVQTLAAPPLPPAAVPAPALPAATMSTASPAPLPVSPSPDATPAPTVGASPAPGAAEATSDNGFKVRAYSSEY